MINQVNSPIIGIKAPNIGASKIKKKMIHFLLSNCINELELDVDDEEKVVSVALLTDSDEEENNNENDNEVTTKE